MFRKLDKPDPFEVERQFIKRAIQPNLVSMDFKQEWEDRVRKIHEMMKQFDEERKQLEASNPAPTESSPAVVAPVNSSDLIEVPE
jgi:hypothetical protein